MTWKERRTVTILSIILAVLAAALLVVLGIRYREHRAADGAVRRLHCGDLLQLHRHSVLFSG